MSAGADQEPRLKQDRAIDPAAQEAVRDVARVLDALPGAVVAVDTSGRVALWNRGAAEVYGWTADEVLGTDVRALVSPAGELELRDSVLRQVSAGEPWHGTLNVVRRDGGARSVAVVAAPLRGSDDEVVAIVAAVDTLTDQRLLERRAADLADNLRLALAAGDLGTWRWDMATGRIVWDENLERLFGLPPGGFDGTFDTYLSLIHPDDRDHVRATVDEALAHHSSYRVDHRVVWPDGSVHWVQGRGEVTLDQDGRPTGTLGCTADITPRKEAELEAERRAAEATAAAARERQQRQRLEFLAELSDAAMESRDHLDFMERAARRAVPQLGDWCTVHFLPQPGGEREVAVAHVDPDRVSWARELEERYPYDPSAPTGVARVIRTGLREFVPEVDAAYLEEALAGSTIDPVEGQQVIDELHLTSIITVPLGTKRGILGAMQLITAESGRRLDADDLALAANAASRMAEILESMWNAEQQARISTILQQALLPPALPEIPGMQVAVRYWAAGASDVGGDFYDVFAMGPTGWALLIGDVCGKGPDAAAVTSIARHTVRAAARHGQDHDVVVDWLNEAVLNSGRGLFCTACYATVEPAASGWALRSTPAGHQPPTIVRADGRVESLGKPGRLLGVFPEAASETATTLLEPGDTVVFTTDGVTDVPEPHDISDEELAEMIADAARAPSAEAVADALRRHVDGRLAIAERPDDIALVVVRVVGPA